MPRLGTDGRRAENEDLFQRRDGSCGLAAAERALALDANLAEAHAARAGR
jgi:hypothetical protein